MKLSDFHVVHPAHEETTLLADPLVSCFAGEQRILIQVLREGLMDYFRISGDRRIMLAQWNLVVERNIEAIKPIIDAKFQHDEWDVQKGPGGNYPKITLTLSDLQKAESRLSIDVINLDAGFKRG
jgi:hypothetical protein